MSYLPFASFRSFAGLLKVITVNFGLILLGLISAELIFGHWFLPYTPPDPSMFDHQRVFSQTLYEPFGTVTYLRDRYGLRGLHAPIADVELVTVGGSTTNQLYITEGQTWQDIIHSETGIVVANAGIDGITLNSHIVAIEDWLHLIPGLSARYFMHAVGINDALRPNSSPMRTSANSWSRWLRPRSALWLAIRALGDRNAAPILVNHGAADLAFQPSRTWQRAEDNQQEAANYVETSFKPTLRHLLEVHRSHNEVAILVSQPANPKAVRFERESVLVSSPSLTKWAVTLAAIGVALQSTCREWPENCRFIDLAGELPLDPDDFYDLVHYTPKGAARIGKYLSSRLGFVRNTRS